MFGRKTKITSAVLLVLAISSVSFYSHFIGFEKDPLSRKVPDDAYAYLSIRHLRKAAVAIATDDQLQSIGHIFQAIAKTIDDSSSIPSFDGPDIEIDEELIQSLGSHFKTQLALVALPPKDPASLTTDLALLSQFYGSADKLKSTLAEIANQASDSEYLYRWSDRDWNSIAYQELNIESLNPEIKSVDFSIYWSVYQDILYITSSQAGLEKLLAFVQIPESERSVATRIAAHQAETFVPSPDLTLYLNSKPILGRASAFAQQELIATGGFAASFTPQTFVEQMGLNQIESLLLTLELSNSKRSFSGLTFSEMSGVLNAISPAVLSPHQYPDNTPIFASESIALDTGQLLLTTKDAFLKAAPIANFLYFGVQSQVLSATGKKLDDILATSFENQATILQTLDKATLRRDDGSISEAVVYDFALKLKLAPQQSVTKLIESQVPTLLNSQAPYAYTEDSTLFIDSDRDASITSGRSALYYDDNYIVIGHGTLKSFNELKSRMETYEAGNTPQTLEYPRIGTGVLSLRNLPSTLYQFATIFYLQLNPDKPLPVEYSQFDWGALTALEQERSSETYHDPNGRFFRVSQELPDAL